jgi:hypothetical protein
VRKEVARKDAERHRYRVGTIAEFYELTALDDATLHQAFLLIARLIKRGHLAWAAQQHEPDPACEHEVQELIANTVTLELDLTAAAVSPEAGSHAAQGQEQSR